ncbi:hypothetical protein BDZ97DRAFT_1851687 [Flammula alnicola]|nr:hypothetical protein BDZ97DRAFT_1851687 [Flammula alnicola]
MSTDSKLSSNWVIDNVPGDVWFLIFSIPTSSDLSIWRSSIRGYPTLCVSQVCSTWRTIAIGAPELWGNIAMEGNYNEAIYPGHRLLLLFLERAASSPCTMRVHAKNLSTIQSNAVLLWRFLNEIHRARYLELDAYVIQYFDVEDVPVESLTMHHDKPSSVQGAPLLEKLVLSGIPTANNPMARMWMPAPSLRTVIIRSDIRPDPSWPSLTDVCIPFQQLTTLELGFSISVQTFFAILSEAGNLVEGKFEQIIAIREFLPDDAPDTPVCLSALQTLELGGKGKDTSYLYPPPRLNAECPPLTELLQYIKAPALKSLRIRTDRDWSSSSITSFICHSLSNIQHLALDIVGSSDEQKVEGLRLLPLLESLQVHSESNLSTPPTLGWIFTNAMQEWDASKEEFCLCPKLKSIRIDYAAVPYSFPSYPDIRFGFRCRFADMVQARWRRSLPESSFKVWVSRVPDRVVEAYGQPMWLCYELIRLLVLKREGLDLIIQRQIGRENLVLESLICG